MRRFQELTVAIGLRVCKLHEESRVELQVSLRRAGWVGRVRSINLGWLTENLPALPPDHHLFHRGFDGQGRVVQLQGILCGLEWRHAAGCVPCVARFQVSAKSVDVSRKTLQNQLLMPSFGPLAGDSDGYCRELRYRHKAGHLVWVQASYSRMYTEQDGITLIGVIEDVAN
eukprot:gene25130-31548_t